MGGFLILLLYFFFLLIYSFVVSYQKKKKNCFQEEFPNIPKQPILLFKKISNAYWDHFGCFFASIWTCYATIGAVKVPCWSKLNDPVAGVHMKDPLSGTQVSKLKRKPIGFLCF